MTVIGVVIIEQGLSTATYTEDDDDEILVLDLDCIQQGACPICDQDLTNKRCGYCGIDWSRKDYDDFEEMARNIMDGYGPDGCAVRDIGDYLREEEERKL